MNPRPMSLHRTVALCGLLAMLVASASTHAAELYRWVEADGSITFSPTPPEAGVDFEQVDTIGAADNAESALSSADVNADEDIAANVGESALAPATAIGAARPDDSLVDPLATQLARPAAEALPVDVDGLSYAPPPMGAAMDVDEGIVPGDPLSSIEADSDAASTSATAAAGGNPASVRRERCRELAKRVISLERRLGTRLSPEDMDNTVLYMARYQASVDQHCKS